jgi:hypothetical protein
MGPTFRLATRITTIVGTLPDSAAALPRGAGRRLFHFYKRHVDKMLA